MKKKLSSIQVLLIGLALYLLSRLFGVGGGTFELGGLIVTIIGIVMIIKEKTKKK